MKCLSIRAPWWWCILYAGKRIENRGDRFPKRYRGPVLLHASKWWVESDVIDTLGDIADLDLLPERAGSWEDIRNMCSCGGHIVGTANIVDIRPSTANPESPWETPEGLGIVLDNVQALKNPIPQKGALGLFNVDWPEHAYAEKVP